MKKYLSGLLLLVLVICSCGGNNSQGSKDKLGQQEDKSEIIDFKAGRLINLNASNKMKDILCQTWDYKEDAADAVNADPSSAIDMVYRGYCLFSDGSMIKDPRGNMIPGKWIVNDKLKPVSISFFLDDHTTEKYNLAYLMPYEMKLVPQQGDNKKIIDLGSEAISHEEFSADPFYLSNNTWRFKPAKEEQADLLKKRLKDCIHFFVLLYEEKINAHSDVISFVGLPSCFKWYGGGIYVQKEAELQEKWIHTFYNKAQALKAYELAVKLISLKYDWPKNETNWLKKNVAVLKQMENRIDSI